MKLCPQCNTKSVNSATTCDCGYSFESRPLDTGGMAPLRQSAHGAERSEAPGESRSANSVSQVTLPSQASSKIPEVEARNVGPAPALWNPNAAACWCLLFSGAFGAFLHARNANALGRADEAKANWIWFFVFIGAALLGLVAPIAPHHPLLFSMRLSLLLFWYASPGRVQIRHVKETWQDRYVHKSWMMPLLIGCCCIGGLFALAYVVAVMR